MPGLFLDIQRLDHEQHSSAFEGMFFVRNWIGEVRALASKWHVEGKCRSTGDTLEFEAGYLGSLLVRVWDEVDKEDIVLSRELRSYMSEIKKWISQVNVQRSLDDKEVMAPLTSLGEVHQGVPTSPACQVFDEIPKPIDANTQEIERLDQISTSTAETVLSTSFIKNPSFVHSGNPRKAIENLLHLRSTKSMDLASKMDDTCVALGELPIDIDDDVDSSATPAISASVTTNCNDLWSGEQFTRDFKVSFGAESGSQCVSSNLSELPQPSVCVSFLDEHVQAVQVISIPLSNNMNLRYMADVINMELRVDVLDCGIDDMIEQTNQFNMSLNQVTPSYASKVFDRMPNRDFGLRSEELCSAAVHILLLQASSNGSCTLWPNKCRLVFEPGGHRALFVNSLPWNWRQVAVEMIHRRLQWDPGDRLIAGSESLHCSLVRAALVQRQVGKIIATRTDAELRLPCCQTGFHFSDLSSAEPEALCFIGFDARQRANSTLKDFCRSYFLFQEMDSSSSSALFRYLPVLSFTLAPEFAILLGGFAATIKDPLGGFSYVLLPKKF